MNRVEFMGQLNRLLCNMPEEERQDAIAYYNDYFDEAGSDREAEILRELGSPGRVAAMIRAGYQAGGEGSTSGEYTEHGYQDTAFTEHAQMPARYEADGTQRSRADFTQNGTSQTGASQEGGARRTASDFVNDVAGKARSWKEENDRRQKTSADPHVHGASGAASSNTYQPQTRQRRGVGGWVLIIILAVFIGLPVVTGVLGGAVGLAGGLFGGVVGLFGAGMGLFGAGIIGIVRGVVLMLHSPGTGLAAMGFGFLSFAAGIMVLIFVIWVACKVIPWLVRTIVNLLSRITHHGQERNQQDATTNAESQEGGEQS